MDPKTFLDRFGRRSPPSAELSTSLADLDRLARERPDLEGPSRDLARLLGVAFLDLDRSTMGEIEREVVYQGWLEGKPAFRTQPPSLDESGLVARARSIVREMGGDQASTLDGALRKRRITFSRLANEIFQGRTEEVARTAEGLGVGLDLLASILRLTLLPTLGRFSPLFDRERPEGVWTRGDCPDCGSRLVLAESRGLEQRIAYRCGLCAGDWPGDRLRCPACGESSPQALHYAFVEGEQDRFRLAHCDACSNHWKIVSTLSPLSPPGILVAELSTFHLDVLAEKPRPAAE